MFKGLRVSEWFRGTRDPFGTALGHLERDVMDVIWHGGGWSVRDVMGQLERAVAYTTVMTTLDRLFKKGFVSRRREGRAFVYTAAHTRVEIASALTSGFLRDVISTESAAAAPFLSNLVDAVGKADHALLDELERIVRDKRQRLRESR